MPSGRFWLHRQAWYFCYRKTPLSWSSNTEKFLGGVSGWTEMYGSAIIRNWCESRFPFWYASAAGPIKCWKANCTQNYYLLKTLFPYSLPRRLWDTKYGSWNTNVQGANDQQKSAILRPKLRRVQPLSDVAAGKQAAGGQEQTCTQ